MCNKPVGLGHNGSPVEGHGAVARFHDCICVSLRHITLEGYFNVGPFVVRAD
jgi:hypothetical protein